MFVSLLSLCCLLTTALADTCYKAQQAFPHNAIYSTPQRIKVHSICPTFESCCSSGAEQEMLGTARSMPGYVYSHLDHYLMMFENHTMMPLYFIPGVDEYTYTNKSFTDTSYTDVFYALIKLLVKDPGYCLDEVELEGIRTESLANVKNITNHLYSLRVNIKAVYNAIKTVRYHNITHQCMEKIARYSVPSDINMTNQMCSVCSDETASARTCKSACVNTVRGCFADVTSLIRVYEEVVREMDKQYRRLKYMLVSRYGDLSNVINIIKQLISTEKHSAECVKDNPFSSGFRDSTNYLNKYPHYYAFNKGLSGALNNPEREPCKLSMGATSNCWSGDKVGLHYDKGYIRHFTEQGQMMNPILPYMSDPNPYIQEAKLELMKALNVSEKTLNNEELLPLPSKRGHDFNKSGASATSFALYIIIASMLTH